MNYGKSPLFVYQIEIDLNTVIENIVWLLLDVRFQWYKKQYWFIPEKKYNNNNNFMMFACAGRARNIKGKSACPSYIRRNAHIA